MEAQAIEFARNKVRAEIDLNSGFDAAHVIMNGLCGREQAIWNFEFVRFQ